MLTLDHSNVAHRSCLLNYLQDDSVRDPRSIVCNVIIDLSQMWLIKSPASFGKEALQLFAKIRKSFTNEGGTVNSVVRVVSKRH